MSGAEKFDLGQAFSTANALPLVLAVPVACQHAAATHTPNRQFFLWSPGPEARRTPLKWAFAAANCKKTTKNGPLTRISLYITGSFTYH
jgi:hypothetical protein